MQDNFVIHYEALERPPAEFGLARPAATGAPALPAGAGSQGGATLPNTPSK